MAHIEYEFSDNWADLHLLIDQYFTHYNGYIFRGQADADWKLESTLTRSIKRFYPNKRNIDFLKTRHLADFKANIRGRCSLDLEKTNDNEIWALGQHFGLHTPLLDWSRSPYVALFFSLLDESPSGKRALWGLLEEDVDNLSSKKKKQTQLKIISTLTHHNPRLVSQNGIFLDVKVGLSVEDIIEKAPKSKYVTMYKISFPDSIKSEALSALNNMNINYSTLFQELTGASLHTNFQLGIEAYLELARSTQEEPDS